MEKSKGQSMVEFALILPIILMIILGIIEAALVVQGHLAVQHAAREAARFAITYQPIQGACMDMDQDGVLEDGINDHLDGGDPDDLAAYPYCPSDNSADIHETDSDYWDRRVELIKMKAREAASGLRIDTDSLGLTPLTFSNHINEPGFFGVGVWGYPSFETNCNAYEPWSDDNDCLDHPGLEGLPVRVVVRHNVEVLDPFYRLIAEQVTVRAETQMVNEGIQVGMGSEPPPSFETGADYEEPDTGGSGDDEDGYSIVISPESAINFLPSDLDHELVATVRDGENNVAPGMAVEFSIINSGGIQTGFAGANEGTTDTSGQFSVILENEDGSEGVVEVIAWLDEDGDGSMDSEEPSDTATKRWQAREEYFLTLSPDQATNELPDDRMHEFVAAVTDEAGQPVQGANVSFYTTRGGFSYSGLAPQYDDRQTGSGGLAPIHVYGNYSDTATIRAWLDYDSDGSWDSGTEPGDQAEKTWTAPGPYVTVSAYEVRPLDYVYIDVMAHDPAEQPYSLLMCPITGTLPYVVDGALEVDSGTWDAVDVGFEIPEDAVGEYRLETHGDSGGCGDTGDRVAYSAPIRVLSSLPPDLTIASLDVPSQVCPETVFAMTAVVENLTGGSVEETFDLDFFVDPEESPPQGPVGETKQWISEIDPGGTVTVTTLMWVDSEGDHPIGVKVDTTDYVAEGDETNNWQVVTVSAADSQGCGDPEPPPWDVEDKPPGLKVCEQLFEAGDFEGRPSSVWEHWSAGETSAYSRQSRYFYDGTMSMRLHASLGTLSTYPQCPPLNPYLYQEVTIPDLTDGYTNTITTMKVTGQRLVGDSLFSCSEPGTVDGDDSLNVKLNAITGTEHLITTGDTQSVGLPEIGPAVCQAEPGDGSAIGSSTRKGLMMSTDRAPLPARLAQSQQVVHSTSFEDDLGGWTATDGTGEAGRNCFYDAYNGDCYARAKDWTSSSPDPTLSRTISTVGLENVRLGYWRADRDCGGNDRFIVEYSLDGGTTWTGLQSATCIGWNWRHESFDLPTGEDDVRIRFTFDGNDWDDYMAVDNIYIASAGTCPFSDDFDDGSFGPQWLTNPIGDADGSVTESGGELTIDARGESTWGTEDDFFYVHQMVSGDFDARVRLVESPHLETHSKLGLMVRNSADDDSRYVMLARTHNSHLQFAVRETDGASVDRAWDDVTISSDPIWARIVREGDTFEFYYSTDTDPMGNWTYQGSIDVDMDDAAHVGIAHASYSSWSYDDGIADDFSVICLGSSVFFDATDYEVNEGEGTATITVTLDAPSSETITVDYATSDGSATAGDDYTAISGTLTFDPDEVVQTFEVPILDDEEDEDDETVTLSISNPTNATLGTRNAATLTIIDDDLLTVDFSSSTYDVNESAGAATITATLNAESSEQVIVNYQSSDITASAGEDYTAVSGLLTFDPGVTEQTFQVPITDDLAFEGSETVSLTLYSESLNWVEDFGGLPNGTTSDSGETAWSVDTSQCGPGAIFEVQDGAFAASDTDGTSTTDGGREGIWESEVIDIARAGDVDISMDIWSEDDADNDDYVAVYYRLDGGSEVLIAERHDDFSRETVEATDLSGDTVQVIVRADLNYDDESYHWDDVAVTGSVGEASVGSNSPARLTIIDNDGTPAVDFSSATYEVDEGAGTATITATLNASSYQTVTVAYVTTLSGTATVGSDYTSVTGTLEFAPGEVVQTFTVPIVDDSEMYEGSETVVLELSNASEADLGTDNNPATLTILDNDVVRVDFSSAEYTVVEGAGTVPITVALNAASAQTVTVEYMTSDGTAEAGSDYTSITTGTFTFAPGSELIRTFDVPIIDDAAYEGNETVVLTLLNPTDTEIGPNSPAELTIVDDEPVVTGEWVPFSVDFSTDTDMESLIGQGVQVRFYGEHDEDEYGTWFYLDDLECEVCTEWPIPEQEPDKAAIGGEIRVLVGGIPKTLQGVKVWAYSQGGEMYHTSTIQDGTYHFYNIEPGTYTVYSEIWLQGELHYSMTTVTVDSGEQDYTVNLLLL